MFGPSIGLCRGDEVLVGVVADPIRQELFYATKGNGAFLNDLYRKGDPRQIHVSNVKKMKHSIVASGWLMFSLRNSTAAGFKSPANNSPTKPGVDTNGFSEGPTPA